jgi:hypothetical protein
LLHTLCLFIPEARCWVLQLPGRAGHAAAVPSSGTGAAALWRHVGSAAGRNRQKDAYTCLW